MKTRKLQSKLTRLLDLTGDVLLDESCMRIEGNSLLHIANHKGLLGYSDENVTIATKGGVIRVQGSGLVLQTKAMGQIIIRGRLETISIDSGGGV